MPGKLTAEDAEIYAEGRGVVKLCYAFLSAKALRFISLCLCVYFFTAKAPVRRETYLRVLAPLR